MLRELYLEEFLEKTASKEPVPGGGSVAALCGALGSSLGAMVSNLTIGKKNYIEHDEKMKEIAARLEGKRIRFLELIDEDAQSFDEVMGLFKLPKETDEEKALRAEKLEAGFKLAAEVPYQVADLAASLMEDLEYLVKNGNKNAVTDALVATMLSRTATLAALYNVKINLGSIKDEAYTADMKQKVSHLENFVQNREKELLELVTF